MVFCSFFVSAFISIFFLIRTKAKPSSTVHRAVFESESSSVEDTSESSSEEDTSESSSAEDSDDFEDKFGSDESYTSHEDASDLLLPSSVTASEPTGTQRNGNSPELHPTNRPSSAVTMQHQWEDGGINGKRCLQCLAWFSHITCLTCPGTPLSQPVQLAEAQTTYTAPQQLPDNQMMQVASSTSGTFPS